ncbi:hypothetical protein MY11210_009361 [Beauveria gryllotalpidicola]
MKAATIILASLTGLALAAPAVEGPTPGSDEDVCVQSSVTVFDKCLKTRQRDEPIESLRERCNEERDRTKQGCVQGAARQKEAECSKQGNRVFAQCMKDMVLNKSGKTRDDCEKKREETLGVCREGTGQTMDEYCQVMAATSSRRFDKQSCLDAFKSCGNPTIPDDAKARDCANQIMEDKSFGKEPLPVPTIPDDGAEPIDQRPDNSTKAC